MTKAVTKTKTALAVRHVHFESLGTLEFELEQAGYELRYVDVASEDIALIDPVSCDLLAILGGPIGVYDTQTYPFVQAELAFIKARLSADLPTLGICLGAQLIAAALGARVAPTGVKEIGFAPIDLTKAGEHSPLRHLAGCPVLHWHGDAFDLPTGTELLATTKTANQAFAAGPNILALQFHLEADTSTDLEAWLVGHAVELIHAEVGPELIRADARRHGSALREAGRAVFAEWLAKIQHPSHPVP
ncbi:glutamine amidotransferase [Nitratireductor soli]|uniref:glutamine amidotransferase n=1 Tax=Nitratireductor soli TaxID=1670619 RepID=UPI00065DC19E|nr:glutamine amidotransferase [Nitratireductor soli]